VKCQPSFRPTNHSMALPDPTSDAFETDSNATEPCMPNLIDYEPELSTTTSANEHDVKHLEMMPVEKHLEMMPSGLHAEVTEVNKKVANFLKKASIVTAETGSCSKTSVDMSQLMCLSFFNPAGHLGEINVEMDMQMEELLFHLSVQMGMKLPLKLVHDTTVLVFAPTDTVGSALCSLPRDVLASPRINLDAVYINNAEREKACCCGSCSRWWFEEGWHCPESSYNRDYAAQLCLLDQWLLAACSAGEISTAQAFLELPCCNVNRSVKIGEGRSRRAGPPWAMWRRSATCLKEAVAAGHSELCTLLIAKKANVNKGASEEEGGYYRGERKETCLYAALKGGHVNICKILIDSKAQVNHCWATCGYRNCERDEKWGSALSVAMQQKAGAELCHLLLEARADPGLGEMRRDGTKGYGKGKGFGKTSGDQNLNDDGIMQTSGTLREWVENHAGPLHVAARRGVDIEQFKVMFAPENDSLERKVAKKKKQAP